MCQRSDHGESIISRESSSGRAQARISTLVEGAGLDQMKAVCLVDSGPIGYLLQGESPYQALGRSFPTMH
jgi:hypothetical protein